MGDLLGSLGYRVQALKVTIDAILSILLVLIPLLHPCEHHPMQWVLSGLFKIIRNLSIANNTHGYVSYINYLLYIHTPKNVISYVGLWKTPNT